MTIPSTTQQTFTTTVSTSKEKHFHSVEDYRRALEGFVAPKMVYSNKN